MNPESMEIKMTNDNPYTPPAVWTWQAENGGTFANINRPIAGAIHDKHSVRPAGSFGINVANLSAR